MKKEPRVSTYFPKEFCIIQWSDASFYADLHPIQTDFSVSPTTSIGWLIQETKETCTIAESICDDGKGVRSIMVIPKAIIMNIQRFKTGGKRK